MDFKTSCNISLVDKCSADISVPGKADFGCFVKGASGLKRQKISLS